MHNAGRWIVFAGTSLFNLPRAIHTGYPSSCQVTFYDEILGPPRIAVPWSISEELEALCQAIDNNPEPVTPWRYVIDWLFGNFELLPEEAQKILLAASEADPDLR